MNSVICLDGRWQFRQSGGGPRRIRSWLPATVPGTVHTDLLAAGKVQDPFYRRNELDQQWIEYADWIYRRTFEVPASFLEAARAVWLDFSGLDTFATVRLNGRLVGRTSNMFHPWRFEVRRLLRTGRNTIELEFESSPRIAEALAAKSKIQYKAVYYNPRIFIRKAQYASGWDWGPRFMTCGAWRSVHLVAVEHAEIRSTRGVTRTLTRRRAVLAIDGEIEAHAAGEARIEWRLVCRATGRVHARTVPLRLRKGVQAVAASLQVQEPRWWWPNGMGEPDLYDLHTILYVNDQVADRRQDRVGLRTVELVRKKDAQGECFRFRINGQDVFCKGANWIPQDSFAPRVTRDIYRARITDARQANMNMLRIWGGGFYEHPDFYEACDELGIMVWQDFMFACAEYPETPAFLADVRREAVETVRALRNHPSLVIWCGNNENHWGYDEWWPPRPARYGESIYDKVLPAVCAKLDPSRPYWPGSPFGGPKANDPNFGDQHVWTVWAFWKNPHVYRENTGRFVSEFGFQAMPCAQTVKAFTEPADRRLFTPVIEHHNRWNDGHPALMKYLAHTIGVPRNIEDYIYFTQVLQIDAVKTGVEHWRHRWPATAGALYWQLNDCWPVCSWSAVDYYGRPKGLWYGSRRFFAPALVSLHPVSHEAFGATDLELWVTHDVPAARRASVEVTSWTVDGRRLYRRVIPAVLPANGARRVATLKYAALGITDPDRSLVHVELRDRDGLISSNEHYFSPIKFVDWPDPGISHQVRPCGSAFEIRLRARRVARAVRLTVEPWEGRFTDNFIDLMPGRDRWICWQPQGPGPDLRGFKSALRLRWMTPTAR